VKERRAFLRDRAFEQPCLSGGKAQHAAQPRISGIKAGASPPA
jgi:hypothetical protein